MRRAVFLDRDGVLNQSVVRQGKPFPPESVSEMRILPGVPESLAALREAGFLTIVATNQPDVASGKQTAAVVEAMHARLRAELPLDDIKTCYHGDADGCECRKPKPGLLLQAAREFGIDLPRSYMVGDRWRDVAAGQAAGCMSFFVDCGYRERRPEPPYIAVKSLAEAKDRILAGFSRENKD